MVLDLLVTFPSMGKVIRKEVINSSIIVKVPPSTGSAMAKGGIELRAFPGYKNRF